MAELLVINHQYGHISMRKIQEIAKKQLSSQVLNANMFVVFICKGNKASMAGKTIQTIAK